MTTDQINRNAMHLAVQGFLTEFLNSTTATSRFPALTGELARLITLNEKIKAHAQTQRIPLAAQLQARDAALAKATTFALELAATLLSYARKNGLPALEVESTLSPTRFKRLRLRARMEIAQRLFDLAEPLQAPLTEIGLTGTTLAEFLVAIDTARTAIGDRDTASADKKVARRELVDLLREADRLIDVLDPMLLRLRTLDRETHQRYLVARTMFNRPARRGTDGNAASTPATAAVSSPGHASAEKAAA
jgi:hypothetical protein